MSQRLPVWTEEECREIVLSGIDSERLRALHSQAMYALTSKIKDNWDTTGSGNWPVFLDYTPNRVEIGNSRMILNTSRILLAEFSGDIEPETRGVDKVTNMLRKGAWAGRAAGDGMGDGGWDVEMASQYTDFRELGAGVVFHDELEDENGLLYETLRHFRATDVVYDRSARNPLHAKWVCRRTWFTKFEAIKRFGKDKIGANDLMPEGANTRRSEGVWLYEFYSVPFAGRRETYCAWVGSIDAAKLQTPPKTSKTKQLCCSWGVNYLPAASRWPIGGVWLQAATQALLNNLEGKLKETSDRKGMTAVDLSKIPGRNVQKAQKNGGWLEMDLSSMEGADIRQVIMEIAGGATDQGDLQLYELYKRQYNEDSGLTEAMRGNLSEEDRTLGEQQLVQAGAEKGQSYEKKQALAMTARLVSKAFEHMRLFDRSPLLVDLDGYDVWLNDPNDPRMSMENVFRDKGVVRIDPGSFTSGNDRIKRAQRAAELNDPALLAMLGKPGGVNPEWFRDELMKTKGEDDPNDYKMPDQGQGGMLGQVMAMMQGPGQQQPAQEAQPAFA